MTRRILFTGLLLLLPTLAHAAAARLHGSVLDDMGKPVAAAEVYIYGAAPKEGVRTVCETCCRECTRKAATDKKGQFTLREVDPASRYRLLVLAKGYEFALADAQPDQAVTIKLRPRISVDPVRVVRGKVVDQEGKPVTGAIVHFVKVLPRTPVEQVAITNGAGEFAMNTGDSRARVDVRVTGRDFAPVLARELTTNTPHTITLGPGVTVTGRATHENTPLPGVRVGYAHAGADESDSLGGGEVGTDAEGRFILTGLAPDTEYHVFGKMESFRPFFSPVLTIRTAAAGSKQPAVAIDVMQGVRVAGFVKGVVGKVPPGTFLQMYRGADMQTAEVDPAGGFAFEGVPLEPVSILVRIRGYRPKRVSIKATEAVSNFIINVGQ